jgi:hypothetical protein
MRFESKNVYINLFLQQIEEPVSDYKIACVSSISKKTHIALAEVINIIVRKKFFYASIKLSTMCTINTMYNPPMRLT